MTLFTPEQAQEILSKLGIQISPDQLNSLVQEIELQRESVRLLESNYRNLLNLEIWLSEHNLSQPLILSVQRAAYSIYDARLDLFEQPKFARPAESTKTQ